MSLALPLAPLCLDSSAARLPPPLLMPPAPLLCPQVEVGRNPALRGQPVAVVQYNPWDTEALKTALRPDVSDTDFVSQDRSSDRIFLCASGAWREG